MKFRSNIITMLGDTHGIRIVKHLIKDVCDGQDIFHVGDLGLGFSPDDRKDLIDLSLSLQHRNLRFFAIRGNHDNPVYWKESNPYKNIFLVKDYTVAQFPNGKTALCIGGGVSIDRCLRTEGHSWWAGEGTSPIPNDIQITDYIFSHDCPSYINKPSWGLPLDFPFLVAKDQTLMSDQEKQRKLLDKIQFLIQPEKWIYGHYHNSYGQEKGGCEFRCLNINEKISFEA